MFFRYRGGWRHCFVIELSLETLKHVGAEKFYAELVGYGGNV